MDDQKDLLDLQGQVEALQKQINALTRSDRRQWAKLRVQQRWSMIFAGVIAVGAALSLDKLSPESRASLEQIGVGIAVMLAGGIGVAGSTSSRFEPPMPPGDDTEDEI